MPATWIGVDIGGANCKFATSAGEAWSRSFALWREPAELQHCLRHELAARLTSQPTAGIAVTMTGELADCFRTKRDGVLHILAAAEFAAGEVPLRIYLTDGRMVSTTEARSQPNLAAASNWHALARLVSQRVGSSHGLLIDIGTTTTDIIPFSTNQVLAQGKTDAERLSSGELVYTGIERTPLGMLLDEAYYRGQPCGIAREVFATTLDAYLWSGDIQPRPSDHSTADGRAATREFAFERLARMVAADRDSFQTSDADWMARQVRAKQVEQIEHGVQQVRSRFPGEFQRVVWSGQADFLAADLCSKSLGVAEWLYLSDRIGLATARCGPAYAVACLAAEA